MTQLVLTKSTWQSILRSTQRSFHLSTVLLQSLKGFCLKIWFDSLFSLTCLCISQEVLLQIVWYGMLKSYYTSLADWRPITNILWCSPDFNHCPRYDFVLAQTGDRPLFAQLVMIFKCNVHGKMFPCMLVWPFDQPVGGLSEQKDQDLGLYHVKTRPNGTPCLISIYSVLWGALLIEDAAAPKEYLVVDTVDLDMFLRMQLLSYVGKPTSQWN